MTITARPYDLADDPREGRGRHSLSTTVVVLDPSDDQPARPRRITARTAEDTIALVGAGVSSLALVWLLFRQILPFSGRTGFVLCWFVLFVALYAAITGVGQPRPIVLDRVMSAVVHGGAAIVGLSLTATIWYTFYKGWPALKHPNFYYRAGDSVGPNTPLGTGGIEHALIGSAIQVGIAVVISLPLGLLTAVYMTEVGGRFSRVVRTVIEAMTALPDLIAGLFVYFIIVQISGSKTGFAVSCALSITMLPIIARSSEVVLRTVASGLREASLALGAAEWRTVLQVVLPTARSGLGTALILGMARGVGESAPLLVVSGVSSFTNKDPFKDPMNSLPFYIYTNYRNSTTALSVTRAFGAASVLLGVVLILFVIVRLLARQRGGNR